MEKLFRIRLYVIEFIIIVISILFLGYHMIIPNISEVSEMKKAEIVQKNLRQIRVALENYYQVAGEYPNLGKEGAINNLRILDKLNDRGEVISFATIYKSEELAYTEEMATFLKSNKVISSNDFSVADGSGGWIYNYLDQTGEIHANLPENIYKQNIKWIEK